MAWTTPGTAVASTVLTASFWNTHVRDNLNDLRSYQNSYASYRYTTGNITLAATTAWANITTIGTAGDLTVSAVAGDVVEAGAYFIVADATADVSFDAVTVVGTAITNSFQRAGSAVVSNSSLSGSGWYCPKGASIPVTGTIPYTLVAGDISSNQVKIRLRYWCELTSTRTLYASTNTPFIWWVRNYGPITS